jgi:RNA polymerase sigma-70 factor (ECF subfamily)
MTELTSLAEQFEANRSHLQAVTYRMLGSVSEADDAVQESWLRLNRSDTNRIHNLGGWLTTVVARVCLDRLRSRRARREEPLDAARPHPVIHREDGTEPEQAALLADSVGLALLVVLETLSPAERLAYVLHDMFDVPFDEIAPIVERSPTAARKLASRARRRVQGAAAAPNADRTRQREVVAAFLAASRAGDFEALLAVLDPDAVLRADEAAVQLGAARELRGAVAVAQAFAGRARAAWPALVEGEPGLVWAQTGRPQVVFSFALVRGRIAAIDLIADPDRVRQLDVTVLKDGPT